LFVDAELAAALRMPARGVERVVTIDDPEFAPGVTRHFDGLEYEAFIDVVPDEGPPGAYRTKTTCTRSITRPGRPAGRRA